MVALHNSPEAEVVLREGLANGTPPATFDRTVRVLRAGDAACSCGAAIGVACHPSNPRRPYCAERLQVVRELAEQGKIEPEIVEPAPLPARTFVGGQLPEEKPSQVRGGHKGGRKSSISDEQAVTMARQQDAGVRVVDIAGEYQVSVSTVKSRITRARESGWA